MTGVLRVEQFENEQRQQSSTNHYHPLTSSLMSMTRLSFGRQYCDSRPPGLVVPTPILSLPARDLDLPWRMTAALKVQRSNTPSYGGLARRNRKLHPSFFDHSDLQQHADSVDAVRVSNDTCLICSGRDCALALIRAPTGTHTCGRTNKQRWRVPK